MPLNLSKCYREFVCRVRGNPRERPLPPPNQVKLFSFRDWQVSHLEHKYRVQRLIYNFRDDNKNRIPCLPEIYRDADKSLALPTSRCILFDGENISFDATLVIDRFHPFTGHEGP